MIDVVAYLVLLASFIFLSGVIIEALYQKQRTGLYDASFKKYMEDGSRRTNKTS